MEEIKAELGLSDAQVEHEGRGYVHADDVVNAGFIQGETSHVVVQVVYDELAVLDDYEGVEVTPITRELRPKDPLGLNLMRITVDGEPIDDPGRSSADIQRCTDVALERADIRFRFDDLESDAAAQRDGAADLGAGPAAAARAARRAPTVRFRMYTNYSHFIERVGGPHLRPGAVRSRRCPLGVVEVGPDGIAEWQPPAEPFPAPVRELKYVLRAYGKEGHFDETEPQPLWIVYADPAAAVAGEPIVAAAPSRAAEPTPEREPKRDGLLAGYGESGSRSGTSRSATSARVKVHGSGIPPQHIGLAGRRAGARRRGRELRRPRRSCRRACTRSRWPCSTRRATASCSCATSSSSGTTGSTWAWRISRWRRTTPAAPRTRSRATTLPPTTTRRRTAGWRSS